MIQSEFDILKMMNDIEYGWVDINSKVHKEINEEFANNYVLQSPEEVLKNKVGVCWDQVELEREYFKNIAYDTKTFFIVHYDDEKCPTHTFLTFKKENSHFWFEHSWEKFRGIHEYKSLDELLKDVQNKFITNELNNNYQIENLIIREYQKPQYGISVQEFYRHCENGERVRIINEQY